MNTSMFPMRAFRLATATLLLALAAGTAGAAAVCARAVVRSSLRRLEQATGHSQHGGGGGEAQALDRKSLKHGESWWG